MPAFDIHYNYYHQFTSERIWYYHRTRFLSRAAPSFRLASLLMAVEIKPRFAYGHRMSQAGFFVDWSFARGICISNWIWVCTVDPFLTHFSHYQIWNYKFVWNTRNFKPQAFFSWNSFLVTGMRRWPLGADAWSPLHWSSFFLTLGFLFFKLLHHVRAVFILRPPCLVSLWNFDVFPWASRKKDEMTKRWFSRLKDVLRWKLIQSVSIYKFLESWNICLLNFVCCRSKSREFQSTLASLSPTKIVLKFQVVFNQVRQIYFFSI